MIQLRVLLLFLALVLPVAAIAQDSWELTKDSFSTTFVIDDFPNRHIGLDGAVISDTLIDGSGGTIRWYYSHENPRYRGRGVDLGAIAHYRSLVSVEHDVEDPAYLRISSPEGYPVPHVDLEVQLLGGLEGLGDTTAVVHASLTMGLSDSGLPRRVGEEPTDPLPLAIWTAVDADLPYTAFDEVATYDPRTRVLHATRRVNSLLVATVASTADLDGIHVFEARQWDGSAAPFFLDNTSATGDVQLVTGYYFPELQVGETRTIDFYYLFATNLDHVPSEFARLIPEPPSVGLTSIFAISILAFLGLKKRAVEI